LNTLLQLAKASAVEIPPEQSGVLHKCHQRNAYVVGVSEEEIYRWGTGITRESINELVGLKCFRIEDGPVYLNEKVALV